MSTPSLARYAWISIGAAVVTIGLKSLAYALTGSVGLLSDAIESGVNLVGGIVALAMLTVAARPADEDHAYGHTKAEYFSSGIEGSLIVVAAISIMVAAIGRLITPKPLEQIGMGLGVSILASLVNLGVALLLLKVARRHNSITLEANAHHLMTDVWTSVAVVAGIGLVAITGWNRLDPLVAILVAVNIVWTGGRIVWRSIDGLMDKALPQDDMDKLRQVIDQYEHIGIKCHQIETRQAGARSFISTHVLVPGSWTVFQGHELLDRLENDIVRKLPNATVSTHLEPQEVDTMPIRTDI